MLLEHGLQPDRTVEFELACARAQEIIAASAGFITLTLSRGIEQVAAA